MATTVVESIHTHVVVESPTNANKLVQGQVAVVIPLKSVAQSKMTLNEPPLLAYTADFIVGAGRIWCELIICTGTDGKENSGAVTTVELCDKETMYVPDFFGALVTEGK